MYKEYWKRTFDYTGESKFSHLIFNILINILILFLILMVGVVVPVAWENTVVDIYYFVMFIMIFPTIAMIVRVIRSFNK